MPRPTKTGTIEFLFDVFFFEDEKVRAFIEDYGPYGFTVYTAALCLIYREGYHLMTDPENFARKIRRLIGKKRTVRRAFIVRVLRRCKALGLISHPLERENILKTSIKEE